MHDTTQPTQPAPAGGDVAAAEPSGEFLELVLAHEEAACDYGEVDISDPTFNGLARKMGEARARVLAAHEAAVRAVEGEREASAYDRGYRRGIRLGAARRKGLEEQLTLAAAQNYCTLCGVTPDDERPRSGLDGELAEMLGAHTLSELAQAAREILWHGEEGTEKLWGSSEMATVASVLDWLQKQRPLDAALATERARAEALGADAERWREYALHCERVLADLRSVAADMFLHWANDRDSKVGKLLAALDGELPGYDQRCDAFRTVFHARPADRAAESAGGGA